MSQNFVNNAPTTALTVAITTAPASGTVETWSVGSPSGFPTAPFEFGIDLASTPEICLCTAITVTTSTSSQWVVQRGFDGATPITHSIAANQIVFITSAITPREGNAHITENYTASTLSTPDPKHPQYFDTAGTRHNLLTLMTPMGGGPSHPIGGQNAAIDTNNVITPPLSHWGNTPYIGQGPNPANVAHVHGREAMAELAGGIWPAGTQALWPIGAPLPPYWLACQGLDVRIDLAPQLYAQIGFTYGTAIDWYPPAPEFPSYVGYDLQTLVDPFNQAQLEVEAPYSYMQDPRQVGLYLPPGSHLYLKTPNINQMPSIPGMQWIIKVDYGYQWTPRPTPPPAQDIYCGPYAIDSSYPQAYALDNGGSSRVIQVKTPTSGSGQWKTPFQWGYDAVMGIPVILGSGYIGPGNYIVGPFLVPVYPNASPLPSGVTLLSSGIPAAISPTTSIVEEQTVQLKSVRIPVINGFGYLLVPDSWANLAGAPFLNASDPGVDGYYTAGDVQAQQRNNQILLTITNLNKVTLSSGGTPTSTPITDAAPGAAVFYPVYT